jgi:hypothetical protein
MDLTNISQGLLSQSRFGEAKRYFNCSPRAAFLDKPKTTQ